MKTKVTMESKDRNLFGIIIRQDTNSFMSVTDLQEAYTRARIEKGWSDKRVNDILSYKTNAERIYFILEKQGFIKTSFPAFMEILENESLVSIMKRIGAYKTCGRGENRTVMCNPYVWMLIALELNPELYATVIIWLTDKLILNRIEAGNNYNTLARSASKFKDVDYVKMAKVLNHIVFGYHEVQLRNKASETELKELEDLQKNLSFSIDMGYINSFEELMEQMRKIYKTKFMDKK